MKIVILLKLLSIFTNNSALDVWESSEYASDSIIKFILKYIIFLYANDKLVILVQNWQIFQACFSCFAVISQVANYKSS